MNFNEITKLLKSATQFDIWQINRVTYDLLNDENKINDIKRKLRISMEITYLDFASLKFIDATILEIRKHKVLVKNKHDNRDWLIYIFSINVDNLTDILTYRNGKSKINFKINDHVGWISQKMYNNEIFGTIIKLNPKKAKVRTTNGELWTVPYSMLFPILDTDLSFTKHAGLVIDSVAITVI